MWPVSSRFAQTVAQNHALVTIVTVTPYGGSPTVLEFASGSVTVDRTQQIRRTATLTVQGGTAAYDLLSTPGARVAISHGFSWGGTAQELVPMIYGELSSAALQYGDGLISIGVADLWQRLAASPRLTAYTPAVTAGRVTEIIACVTDAFPGITIRNTATDTGTVGTAQAWTSRAEMIAAFATDGGSEAFFAPDGAFVIRPIPQLTDPPAWLIEPGEGGTLTGLTRTRPLDRLYNTVTLTPATADTAQTWTQVTVQVDDPANPRHPDRIGVRPFVYAAPTLLTETEAADVATQLLSKVQGTTETLALGAMAHPALEGGDIIQVTTLTDTGTVTVSHFADSMTFDLAAGDMTANTRSDTELAA